MTNHKNRLDRLANQIPTGDDDEIVIIRLVWGGDPDPPMVFRVGKGGRLIRKIGIDTIPQHLRGPAVNITTHWDDIEIIE